MRVFVGLTLGLLTTFVLPAAVSHAATGDTLISHYVPADILAAMQAVDPADRDSLCQPSLRDLMVLEREKPELAIKGFSSQMYDTEQVGKNLNDFTTGLSELAAGAIVSGNDDAKTLYIKTLAKWARAGAYMQTIDCADGNCGGEWQSRRGTELAPVKDYDTVEENLLPILLTYYGFFDGYEPDKLADDHKAIRSWLGQIEERLPSDARKPGDPFNFGFGFGLHWQTWGAPVIDLLKDDGDAFQKRLRLVQAGLDKIVLPDGSMDQRTTRGSRALWYHMAAIQEAFFALEMLKANGTDLYPKFGDRLEKSVKIFLDAEADFDQPGVSSIYKWAKADFHSAGDPKHQMFQKLNGELGAYTSWMFMYLKRFPGGQNAQRLRSLIGSFEQLPPDDYSLGLNYGCLYQLSDPDFVKRNIAQTKATPENMRELLAILENPESVPKPKSLAVDAMTLQAGDSNDKFQEYLVTLRGAKIDDTTLQPLTFSIFADFKKSGSKSAANLDLLRLKVDTTTLSSAAAQQLDFANCGPVAAQPGEFRLHFGMDTLMNDCILMQLPSQESETWRSVAANLPQLIHLDAQEKDKLAMQLDPLFKSMVAKTPPADTVVATLAPATVKELPAVAPVDFSKASLLITAGDSGSQFDEYRMQLTGAVLNGKPIYGLSFSLLTGYKSVKKTAANIELVQVAIAKSSMADPLSRSGHYEDCGDVAGDADGLRLQYGNQSFRNSCVLKMMAPADAALWQSILQEVPILVHQSGDAMRQELDPLFAEEAKYAAK